MTDPLSITVGILAIAGACSAGVKLLRTIYKSSYELTRLANELEHLEDIIKAVDDLFARHGLKINTPEYTLMKKATDRARVTTQALQSFLQSRLDHTNHVRKRIRQRLLVKDRKKLKKFAEEIHTARTGEIAASLAMVLSPYSKSHSLQKYFIIFAETARLFRRVTITAKVSNTPPGRVGAGTKSSKNELFVFMTLPQYLNEQLPNLLRRQRLFDTVTEIRIPVEETGSGSYAIKSNEAIVHEDIDEAESNHEEYMLREIGHLGCPQYLESEVIVHRLIRYCTFLVQVEGQLYIERQLPCSASTERGDDAVQDFYSHLRTAFALRDCDKVVKFVGVVLSDTRKHLKGYLQEYPARGTLMSIVVSVQLYGHQIPWNVREYWVKQLVTAVAEVHSRGHVLGGLNLQSISVRLDGSIVLSLRTNGSFYRHDLTQQGKLDLARTSKLASSYFSGRRSLDFSTDIFQLDWRLVIDPITAKMIITWYIALSYLAANAFTLPNVAAATLLPLNTTILELEATGNQLICSQSYGTFPGSSDCSNAIDKLPSGADKVSYTVDRGYGANRLPLSRVHGDCMIQIEVAGPPRLPSTITLIPDELKAMARRVQESCTLKTSYIGGFMTGDLRPMTGWLTSPEGDPDKPFPPYTSFLTLSLSTPQPDWLSPGNYDPSIAQALAVAEFEAAKKLNLRSELAKVLRRRGMRFLKVQGGMEPRGRRVAWWEMPRSTGGGSLVLGDGGNGTGQG
ncbi:MAG: hypothetical protein Q9220_006271 [cf. Caloplaca sp. 1 TL-2023]